MTKFAASERFKIAEHLGGVSRGHRLTGLDSAQALISRDIIACPSRRAAESLLARTLNAFDPQSDLEITPIEVGNK